MAVAALVSAMAPASALSLCPGDHLTKRTTCLVDGDTGWQGGRKWRLLDIDAPEISNPGCADEARIGAASRDRLLELMSDDYSLHYVDSRDAYGRSLVTIRGADGRDLGSILITERLAQPWPNRGNRWCAR